jgi:hypothetical protein
MDRFGKQLCTEIKQQTGEKWMGITACSLLQLVAPNDLQNTLLTFGQYVAEHSVCAR